MDRQPSVIEVMGALRRAVFIYKTLTPEQGTLYCRRVGLDPALLQGDTPA